MRLNCHKYYIVNVDPSHRAMLSTLWENLYSLEKFPWTFEQVLQETCWNVTIQDKTEIIFSSHKTATSKL